MQSLFIYGRVITTVEKAKEFRGRAEHLITLAKKGGLANFRRILRTVQSPVILRTREGSCARDHSRTRKREEVRDERALLGDVPRLDAPVEWDDSLGTEDATARRVHANIDAGTVELVDDAIEQARKRDAIRSQPDRRASRKAAIGELRHRDPQRVIPLLQRHVRARCL